MTKKLKLIYNFIKNCLDDQITLYSAQLSFYMLFSLIPIIMIVIAILQFVFPVSEADFMDSALRLLPAMDTDIIKNVFNNLFSNATSTIISVSAITVLWSASKVVYSLVLGLNNIHHTIETRNNIIRRFVSVLYTLVLILIIIFYFVFLVFGNYIQLYLENLFPILIKASFLIICLRTSITILMLVLFFALIYMALPDKKLSYRMQIPGAIFATSCWLGFSYLFNIYINNFSNYSYIYGSLAAIVLFLLWVYCCMIILLAGAELNIAIDKYHTEKKKVSEK